MEVRGFLVSRNHRVCDALLERQVPGLHVVSYSEGIVRLQEGLQGFFPKECSGARGELKTDPKCEGGLTAESAAFPPGGPPQPRGRSRTHSTVRPRAAAGRRCGCERARHGQRITPARSHLHLAASPSLRVKLLQFSCELQDLLEWVWLHVLRLRQQRRVLHGGV